MKHADDTHHGTAVNTALIQSLPGGADERRAVKPAGTAGQRPPLTKAEQLAFRTEIGIAGKSRLNLSANAHHYRTRQERLAQRIPDFESYRQMVVDDLREYWHHDHMHKVRTVHNQAEHWRRLFTCWARITGESRVVKIAARGYDGSYECELIERRMENVWERFIDAGVVAGVPLTTLNSLYDKHKDAPAKTIRANKRVNWRGTGQIALPGQAIETVISDFQKESPRPNPSTQIPK